MARKFEVLSFYNLLKCSAPYVPRRLNIKSKIFSHEETFNFDLNLLPLEKKLKIIHYQNASLLYY